jgi:hypothetical protein
MFFFFSSFICNLCTRIDTSSPQRRRELEVYTTADAVLTATEADASALRRALDTAFTLPTIPLKTAATMERAASMKSAASQDALKAAVEFLKTSYAAVSVKTLHWGTRLLSAAAAASPSLPFAQRRGVVFVGIAENATNRLGGFLLLFCLLLFVPLRSVLAIITCLPFAIIHSHSLAHSLTFNSFLPLWVSFFTQKNTSTIPQFTGTTPKLLFLPCYQKLTVSFVSSFLSFFIPYFASA